MRVLHLIADFRQPCTVSVDNSTRVLQREIASLQCTVTLVDKYGHIVTKHMINLNFLYNKCTLLWPLSTFLTRNPLN